MKKVLLALGALLLFIGIGHAQVGQLAPAQILGNPTAARAPAATPTTISAILDRGYCAARGSILFRGAATWTCLSPGTAGYLLRTGGAGQDVTWSNNIGAAVGTSLDLTTGANNHLILNRSSTDGTYNIVSLNGNVTFGASQGMYAGSTSDPWLYYNTLTGGAHQWRINGASVGNLSATQLSIPMATAATSVTTGSITTPGGISTAGNIYGGTALRIGADPYGGGGYSWFNAAAATSSTAFGFSKSRDATNARRWTFNDVGGLTTDPGGGGFWRGLTLNGPTITDPSGGANRFPTASLFYEFNSLTAPTSRNFVLDIANTTATAASQFVLRIEGASVLFANPTTVTMPGAAVVQGNATVQGAIFAYNDINMTRTGGGGASAFITVDNVTTTSINIAKAGGGNITSFGVNAVSASFAGGVVINGGISNVALDVTAASQLVALRQASGIFFADPANTSNFTARHSATGSLTINYNGGGTLFTLTSAGALTVSGVVSGSGANFSGLTASRLIATDGSKNLVSTITSANLAASISDETGTGAAVFATSPTLVTPVLGAATATSINGLTITSSTGTLTVANGKTGTFSNTLTFTGTDGSSVAFGGGGTVTYTIASGTAALGTGAISSAACATVVTVSATGVATTDVVDASFNGDPTGSVGYQPGAMLSIVAYPTANNVNLKVCNNTGSSITPAAQTINWKVRR